MKTNRLTQLLIIFTCGSLKEVQGSCSQSWLSYSTKCFKITSGAFTWSQAYNSCHLSGGELISISSEDILEYFTLHLEMNERYWVSLSEIRNSLVWGDGSSADDQPWVVRTPVAYIDSEETKSTPLSCFVFDHLMAQPDNCNSTHGFICSKNKTLFDPVENCLAGLTEHSFIGEDTGSCLYRSPDATKRENAEAKCAETGGRFLDLDEITRNGLSAFNEHKVMTNDGFRYWTEMTYNDSKLFWKNNQPFTSNIPLEKGRGSCVTVSFNFSTALVTQLYQTECQDQAHVICAAPSMSATTPSLSTIPQPQQQVSLYCPQGQNWKSSRVTGACYWETSFETSRLSWDDARAYCQGFGGDLASFHSMDEEKIGLSFQYGSLAHPYWIGLRLDLESETYKWSDGSSLDYLNWAPGHPDHKDKRQRCVAMDAANKHWISSLCGIISWFVCKAPKLPYPVTPTIPPRVSLTECVGYGFSKLFYFRGYCYEVVNMNVGWHRAKEHCENKGSSLVSIHSDEEIGFLLRLLYDDKHVRGNRVWIGLNSLSGTFRWTDWSPVDLTYWNTDEPNNYLNQEKCGNMYIGNGLWNDENCNNPMGFICKLVKDATDVPEPPTTIDPLMGNCKKGWYPHYDSCYLPVGMKEKDRVNWTTASDICQKLGGYLVSIRDDREQAFLSYLLQGLKEDTWIGLHDTIQSNRYYWVDNSDMRYTNWAVGEPSFFGIQEDCVKMVYDQVDSGVWKDDLCSNELPYICQVPKDPNLPQPDYDRGTSCIHPQGWLKLDDMCFKMFAGNPLTWSEAETTCQREGAHLISMSGTSVQAVATFLGKEVNKTFWIGLQYKKSSQTFEWLNGWIMTFSKWGKDALSGLSSGGSCYGSTSDGYWRSFPCNEEMPYMCQITTGKGPYLRKYGGDCPKTSPDWIASDGSYCHLFGKARSDWFSATLRCFRYGSYLISLHSLDDIEMVRRTWKSLDHHVPSVFIGLMRNQNGGFSWSDQSPVDFVNWDVDQPEDGENSCVEMMMDNLKWRLVPCSVAKYFVCSQRKDQESHNVPEKFEAGASSGLSAGMLTGILVCVVLVIIIIVGLVLFCRPSLGRTRFRIPFRQHSMSFENALYNVDSASMEFQDEGEKRRCST